jgi:hypothetical protein
MHIITIAPRMLGLPVCYILENRTIDFQQAAKFECRASRGLPSANQTWPAGKSPDQDGKIIGTYRKTW